MHLVRTVLLAASAAATAAPALMNDIRDSFFDASTLLLPRQTKNLQTFAGALGGIKADAVSAAARTCLVPLPRPHALTLCVCVCVCRQVIETSGTTRPFRVAGDTFPDLSTAAGRSCDNQKNACAQSANNGSKNFTVADCDSQNSELASPFRALLLVLRCGGGW